MLKEMKDNRRYIFCNIDEPYAEAVYAVIKCGQMAKGEGAWPEGDITFREWIEWTWGDKPQSREPLPCPNSLPELLDERGQEDV